MSKRSGNFLYGMTLFFIALTGFAQMPIFKRYYIADIPGLGWLAQFYITHSLHYGLAALFIAIAVYALMDLLLTGRGLGSVTGMGLFKGGMVLGLVITGVLMVVRNLPGIQFSHVTIYIMNLAHLGCCMGLLGASVLGLFKNGAWVRR